MCMCAPRDHAPSLSGMARCIDIGGRMHMRGLADIEAAYASDPRRLTCACTLTALYICMDVCGIMCGMKETEAAYMKILESSQTLLHVLKRETVSLVKKKQSQGDYPASQSQQPQQQSFASASSSNGGGGYVSATRTK